MHIALEFSKYQGRHGAVNEKVTAVPAMQCDAGPEAHSLTSSTCFSWRSTRSKTIQKTENLVSGVGPCATLADPDCL